MHWLKHQGADKVADLNQLPPGTYSCKDLAESLGLPMLKAQRLLSAFEGTKSSAIRPEATLHCAALCTLKPRRPARDDVAVLHARHANSERGGVGASQQHAAKAPAPIQPVPPPQPQLAPMFAHMAIAASPPVRYLRMRVPRTAYPRLPCRRGS
jgi:hypothetical protein